MMHYVTREVGEGRAVTLFKSADESKVRAYYEEMVFTAIDSGDEVGYTGEYFTYLKHSGMDIVYTLRIDV